MTRIDKVVKIIRGMTDKQLKNLIIKEIGVCPSNYGVDISGCKGKGCKECWEEEGAE